MRSGGCGGVIRARDGGGEPAWRRARCRKARAISFAEPLGAQGFSRNASTAGELGELPCRGRDEAGEDQPRDLGGQGSQRRCSNSSRPSKPRQIRTSATTTCGRCCVPASRRRPDRSPSAPSSPTWRHHSAYISSESGVPSTSSTCAFCAGARFRNGSCERRSTQAPPAGSRTSCQRHRIRTSGKQVPGIRTVPRDNRVANVMQRRSASVETTNR